MEYEDNELGNAARERANVRKEERRRRMADARRAIEDENRKEMEGRKKHGKKEKEKLGRKNRSLPPAPVLLVSPLSSMPLGSLSSLPPSNSSAVPQSSNSASASADEFGVTYKSMKPAYTLPSGPSFADEKEYELEMDRSPEKATLADQDNDQDDDDEFEFGDGDVVGAAPVGSKPSGVVPAPKDDSESLIISSLMEESRMAQRLAEGSSNDAGVMEEAAVALGGLVDRYSTASKEEVENFDGVRSRGGTEGTFGSIESDMRRGSLIGSIIGEEEEEEEVEGVGGEEEEPEKVTVVPEPSAIPYVSSMDKAAKEWGHVPTKDAGAPDVEVGVGGSIVKAEADVLLSSKELIRVLRGRVEMDGNKKEIVSTDKRRGSWLSGLKGTTSLKIVGLNVKEVEEGEKGEDGRSGKSEATAVYGLFLLKQRTIY